MAGKKKITITSANSAKAELQIREKQREVKYDLRDFTVGYIVQMFHESDFFIPEYQREFIWRNKERSRFIESIMLGLPIPMMFVAEMDDGRLEIVDGAQRIQTLEAFLSDSLVLDTLEKLTQLNGFRFSDLPDGQRRKLQTKALRLVVLEEETTLEIRQEIFNRVNTSGMKAKPSEVRRGTFRGPLMDFIKKCAKDRRFLAVCPLSKIAKSRHQGEELVLRFFAYSANYKNFQHDVDKFLQDYVVKHQKKFDENNMKSEFDEMLKFVKRHFKNGFAKSPTNKSTPRVRFEAISVGVNLALKANPDLSPSSMAWLDSKEFINQTRTHASNSGPRVRGRVEFVRDQLLSESV